MTWVNDLIPLPDGVKAWRRDLSDDVHDRQEAAADTFASSRPDAIRKMLDLSTAHLPESLGTDLTAEYGVTAYRTEYGFLMWVPDDPSEVNDDASVPSEVLIIQKYARALGCDYVLFDRDGPINPNLPTWEW